MKTRIYAAPAVKRLRVDVVAQWLRTKYKKRWRGSGNALRFLLLIIVANRPYNYCDYGRFTATIILFRNNYIEK